MQAWGRSRPLARWVVLRTSPDLRVSSGAIDTGRRARDNERFVIMAVHDPTEHSAGDETLVVPGAPTVDEACHWLATQPTLDQVALRLRHARHVMADLEKVIRLLDNHVSLATGKPLSTGRHMDESAYFDMSEEPY